MEFDRIIIGAGLYGLFSALHCGKKGEKILVLETDEEPFMRATYINQARVHMGYHYPRSLFTAEKSKDYFDKFVKDYGFCINDSFRQVYATSSNLSWTDADKFKKFCASAEIMCEELPQINFFREGMCDGAFLTKEFSFDALILRDYFVEEISRLSNVKIIYNNMISSIIKEDKSYVLETDNGSFSTGFLLNTTYASTNQIINLLGFTPFKIKYELCEIILCKINDELKDVGITVMDGPFFSIMPFGKTGLHSLTSVTFTPHVTSYENTPVFKCQEESGGKCTPEQLYNCNLCPAKPKSAWPYMSVMSKKYLKDKFEFEYHSSLYSMKPILMESELDDSRPTIIKKFSEAPTFISVLSGKINTVYDLEEVLDNDR